VADSSVSGEDYTKEYVLDLVGNRTKLVETKEGQSAVTTTSTFNARDQLLTETTGGTTINYSYDSNGSLITQTGRTQSWDLRGRLSGATVEGQSANYRYTPDGIRSSVTEGGTTIDYIIDGMTPSGYQQVVEETSGGVLAVRYTYGASLDPISETRGGTSSLYLGDGHSGARQAISLAGAVVLAQRFDAFGVSVAKSGTLNTAIGYRGERFDATLGQYYLRARYYDPRSGRFAGVDPIAGTYGDPLQILRYGYVGANPLNAIDPSGTFMGYINAGITALINISARGMNLSVTAMYYTLKYAVLPLGIITNAEKLIWGRASPLTSFLFDMSVYALSIEFMAFSMFWTLNQFATDARDIWAPFRNLAERTRYYVHSEPTLNSPDRAQYRPIAPGRSMRGNVAVAEVRDDRGARTAISVSGEGQYNLPGLAPYTPPEHMQIVTGQANGYPRAADAEAKLLETLLRDTRPNGRGTVRIYSERPVCESCAQYAIPSFQQQRRGYRVITQDGNGLETDHPPLPPTVPLPVVN
jgi:RHS repeat-associated protein